MSCVQCACECTSVCMSAYPFSRKAACKSALPLDWLIIIGYQILNRNIPLRDGGQLCNYRQFCAVQWQRVPSKWEKIGNAFACFAIGAARTHLLQLKCIHNSAICPNSLQSIQRSSVQRSTVLAGLEKNYKKNFNEKANEWMNKWVNDTETQGLRFRGLAWQEWMQSSVQWWAM